MPPLSRALAPTSPPHSLHVHLRQKTTAAIPIVRMSCRPPLAPLSLPRASSISPRAHPPTSICFRDAQIFELIIDPIRWPLVPDEHHHPAILLDPGVRQANGGFELIVLVLAARPGGPYGQLRWGSSELSVRHRRIPQFPPHVLCHVALGHQIKIQRPCGRSD
jgi:hypothetical protein